MENFTYHLHINDTQLRNGLTQLFSQLENFSEADMKVADIVLSDGGDARTGSDHIIDITPADWPIDFKALVVHVKSKFEHTAHLKLGDVTLDFHQRHIYDSAGQEALLTEMEIELLKYLNNHLGQSCSKDDLLKNVWQYADDVTTHTVETHIYRLRQKFPPMERLINTTENGYMLNLSGETDDA